VSDNNTRAAIGGAIAIIVTYTLQQFAVELGAGHVPIPEAWHWTVPIVTALIGGVLATLTPSLRRSS
jgi:lipopolysaccharide export LptBFGC system permease protein LptF